MRVAPVLLVTVLALTARGAASPADPAAAESSLALDAVGAMAKAWAEVDNYRCLFVREERIEGSLGPREEIRLRFKKPFAVAMRWVGKVHHGREAVYVEGRNRGRIRASEGGILGLVHVNLDPLGKTAMRDNRHPLTEIGIGHAIAQLEGELGEAAAEHRLDARLCPDEAVAGRPARVVEAGLGTGRELVLRVVWIDAESGLPVRIEGRDRAGDLLERYEYLELERNVGLDAGDFPA